METSRILVFHLVLVLALDYCRAQKTFRNPILDEPAHDPGIIKHQDFYYLTFNRGNYIELLKSSTLSNFRNAERKEIHRDATEGSDIYAIRTHSFQGELYIYYSKRENVTDWTSLRMYVIQCLDPRDPLGAWSNEIRILPEEEVYSHHGGLFQYNNGDLYYLWTRHLGSSTTELALYIARMENPLKVVAPGTLLRAPTMDWEKHISAHIYAPVITQNHGRTLLTFSASSGRSPDRCLGVMGIDGGRDPMLPSNWWNDVNHCVFARNDAEQIWGPGEASFVRSPDDSELWMLYTGWPQNVENGQNNRTARIQKIEWEFNNPKFPSAVGYSRDLVVPQGE